MAGILYGVGVGPGDPELMTVKAVKTIRKADVIACPGENAKETTAFKIAVQMVPELETKTVPSLDMPMVMSRDEQKKHHRAAAIRLEEFLRRGIPVVFLTMIRWQKERWS